MVQEIEEKDPQPLQLQTRYLGPDLVAHLTSDAPTDWVWDRPGRGKKTFKYVAAHFFTKRLNECFGFLWSFRVISHERVDDQIVVLGELEILVPGTTITREYPDGSKETIKTDPIRIVKQQFGSSEVKKWSKDVSDGAGGTRYKKGSIMDLGDDYKGAATDARKKCGLELGMFPNVYFRKGSDEDETSKAASSTQLEALYVRGEKHGLDRAQVEDLAKQEIPDLEDISDITTDQVMKLITIIVKGAKSE